MQSVADSNFLQYIKSNLLDEESEAILAEILATCDVYVFSGVIRDYFIGHKGEHRDLDLVLEQEIDWRPIYRRHHKKVSVAINSYGGIKANIGRLNVDIWSMERTWGIVRKGIRNTPQNLVRTAFFNFSAVTYSIKRRRFYFHRCFAEFVATRHIGILYRDNPNIPLCILNAMYYRERLNMPLTPELKAWIATNQSIFDNYSSVQLSHWGTVQYNDAEVRRFLSECQTVSRE